MNEREIKQRMEKVISFLEENLRKLRTGRAHVSLLESVKIEAYDTMMPLNQLANISVLDYKSMVVQPWDKSNVDAIVKSLTAANLGMTPIKDGDIVRISVPELTEERRKELTKVVGTYEEEAKIALRQVRKEAIEQMKNDKEATEDDIESITQQADKMIKEFNDEVARLAQSKREDMMAI